MTYTAMTKRERIQAALRLQEVDRVPINIWSHLSTIDQDPVSLAQGQFEYAEKYDFDFIKMMPFGLYGVQDYGAKITFFNQVDQPPILAEPGIHKISDWGELEVLPAAIYGTYGKQVQFARTLAKLNKGKYPLIQTVFSPLTTARKLAGDRVFVDMKADPALFKQALQVLTDTTIEFVKANIEAGVDGFFFASQCSVTDLMTEKEYKEFGTFFDLQVIEAFRRETWFNVVHIHGDNGMFDLLGNYPVQAISWHDRWSRPSLAEARSRIPGKALLGGIREIGYPDITGKLKRPSLLETGSISEIEAHIHEAIQEVDGRGLILGPGCCASQKSGETQLFAARGAVETYKKIISA